MKGRTIWDHRTLNEAYAMPAPWQAGLILLTCVLLVVFGIEGAVSPTFLAWLPSILALSTFGLIITPRFLARYRTSRCASCGSVQMNQAQDFIECPNCKRLFRRVPVALPRKNVLSLAKIQNSSDPFVSSLGKIIALAIRDGAREIRISGRKFCEDSDRPWDAFATDWCLWQSLDKSSDEVLQPRGSFGPETFLIFREIYHKARKDKGSREARFRIEGDDCSIDAQLSVEECEKYKVARIVLNPAKSQRATASA